METSNLKLPVIVAAQAQKHVTHNEALTALDAVVQLAVEDRDLAVPPASPVEGTRYIPAVGASGLWTGQAGRIAAFQNGAWIFYQPREGWLAWVADEDKIYAYSGTNWAPVVSDINQAPLLGVNTTADASNRLSVASPATLLTHEGAGHQLKINKAASGDTASLLFQTGYSGRAEIGLAGDDDLHIKVSADGNSWKEALVINRSTGAVVLSNSSTALVKAGAGRTAIVGAFLVDSFSFAGGSLELGASATWFLGVDMILGALTARASLVQRDWVPVARVVVGASQITSIEQIAPAVPALEPVMVQVSAEGVDAVAGTERFVWVVPRNFTLDHVLAQCSVAPTGGIISIAIKRGGTTILGTTPLVIYANKIASVGAVRPEAVQLSAGDVVTFDLVTVGPANPGRGIKVNLVGRWQPTAAPAIATPIDLLVFFGDSNSRGSLADPETFSFVSDSNMLAWNGNAFAQYVPNLNPGSFPAVGLTGLHLNSPDGRWSHEAQVLKRYRASNPSRPVAVFKFTTSGSFAGWDAAVTGGNTFMSYNPTSGALFGVMTTEIGKAIAALTASGYAPTIKLVVCNLGVNDAAHASLSSVLSTSLNAILTQIRAQWPVTPGVTRYILNRITTEQPNAATVRTQIVSVASGAAAHDVFWIDTDAASKNPAPDQIHYNAAGQIAIGEAIWARMTSAEDALILLLGSDALHWWDASYGVTRSGSNVTAWADRIAELSPAQATAANQPTWAAADYNGGPSVTFDGVNDALTLASVGSLPTGATPSWVWLVAQQDALVADASNRCALAWGGTVSPPSTERRIRRAVVSGVNRFNVSIGAGSGVSTPISEAQGNYSGKNLALAKIIASAGLLNVNNSADTYGGVVPATGNGQMSLGSGPNTEFWQGKLRHVLVTAPLSQAKEAAVRALLSAA